MSRSNRLTASRRLAISSHASFSRASRADPPPDDRAGAGSWSAVPPAWRPFSRSNSSGVWNPCVTTVPRRPGSVR